MNQLTFENVKVSAVDKPEAKQPDGCTISENEIAPMCSECIDFTGKRCPGKKQLDVVPATAPCRRYNFDIRSLDDVER